MDKGSKALGWLGLIVGGVLSIGANVRSIHLPDMPTADAGSYVAAVAPVVLAMIGIEQVSRWKHLPNALRFGAVGIASLIAAVASWTHIVSVMQYYGQPDAVAYTFPIAVDGIMLLSSVALFVPFPVRTDTDTPPVRTAVALSETVSAWTDELPDNWTPDTVTVPDMDTLPPAPVSPAPVRTPRPRTPRTEPEWKARARDLIAAGLSDSEIAGKILADEPETWRTPEAGRKAVSRLR